MKISGLARNDRIILGFGGNWRAMLALTFASLAWILSAPELTCTTRADMRSEHPIPAQDLMHYIVHHVPNPEQLGHTKLVKLLYFVDLYCRQYLGRPASEFSWGLYKHGPFPAGRKFYDALLILESRGDVVNIALPCVEGRKPHQVKSERECDGDQFSPEILAVVQAVLSDLGSFDGDTLRKKSYQTTPVRAICPTPEDNSGDWQDLDMESVNNVEKNRLGGLNLCDVLEGSKQYRDGRITPWHEFEPEFRRLSDRAGEGESSEFGGRAAACA